MSAQSAPPPSSVSRELTADAKVATFAETRLFTDSNGQHWKATMTSKSQFDPATDTNPYLSPTLGTKVTWKRVDGNGNDVKATKANRGEMLAEARSSDQYKDLKDRFQARLSEVGNEIEKIKIGPEGQTKTEERARLAEIRTLESEASAIRREFKSADKGFCDRYVAHLSRGFTFDNGNGVPFKSPDLENEKRSINEELQNFPSGTTPGSAASEMRLVLLDIRDELSRPGAKTSLYEEVAKRYGRIEALNQETKSSSSGGNLRGGEVNGDVATQEMARKLLSVPPPSQEQLRAAVSGDRPEGVDFKEVGQIGWGVDDPGVTARDAKVASQKNEAEAAFANAAGGNTGDVENRVIFLGNQRVKTADGKAAEFMNAKSKELSYLFSQYLSGVNTGGQDMSTRRVSSSGLSSYS
jgi:hypothetical protein